MPRKNGLNDLPLDRELLSGGVIRGEAHLLSETRTARGRRLCLRIEQDHRVEMVVLGPGGYRRTLRI